MNLVPVPPGLETECFVLEAGALRHTPEVIRRHWPAHPVWLIADENTWAAAGAAVAGFLEEAGVPLCRPYLFPGKPILHAEIGHCETLTAAWPGDCVPVAVGSGTVNDLVKYASGVKGVRYLTVPTAPSVDGYTSYGAALQVDHAKKTMPCPAPLAIVADTEVLASAPDGMLAGGYADLMAKIPAGADWIVADFLGLHPVRPDVWELIQSPLRDWLTLPVDIMKVFMGLAATGYAMQMCRDSRPASGAEHLISHVWEMENLEFHGEAVSHGFKVAVGSVATTRLFEKLFALDAAEARRLARPPVSRVEREAEIAELTARGCYGEATRQVALEKFLTGDELLARREKLYAGWEGLKAKIGAQLYPSAELGSMLRAVGAPVEPEDIGLSQEQFRHGVATAQLIRNRYTILDLVYELGLDRELF